MRDAAAQPGPVARARGNVEVLLVHCSNWFGVARLPQLYAAAGATVRVLCAPGAFVERTRFADAVFHGSPDPDAMCDVLQRHLATHGDRYTAIVITEDVLLDALVRRAGEPWVAQCLPYARPADPATVALAVSKSAFLTACAARGLPIPASVLCETTDEAHAAARTIGFPLVVKCDRGKSGEGVVIAGDAAELERALAAFAPVGPVAVQRFVRGRVGATDVVYDDGVQLCRSSFYKETNWPEPTGPSARRRYADPPGIEELARRIGEMTGFHGLAVFCWVEDEHDGTPQLLELNFRPGPGPHHRGPVRRTIATALRALLNRTPYEGPATPDCAGATMHMFPQELHRAIFRRDVAAVLGALPGLVTANDLPLDDPPLLWAHARYLVDGLVARLRKRKEER